MFNASDLMKRTPSQIDDILAAMGTGRDRIVAHINPREAAILKALGGSGTINPRTGMLQFDDGDGGDSGGDGMGGDGMGGFGGGDGGFGGFGGGGDSLGGWGGSGDMGGGWGGFGEGFGGLGDATGGFASGIGGYDNTSDVLGTWGGWGVDFGGLGDTLSGWGSALGDYLGSLGIGAPSTPGVTDAIGGDVDAGWSTTGYQEGTPENDAAMAGLESYGQATSPASYDKTDRGLDMISGLPGFSTMMNYAPSSMMGIGGFVGDPLGSLSSAAKGLGKAAGIAGLSSLLGIAAAPVAGPLAAALVSAGISPGLVGSLYGLGTTALGRSAYGGLEEAISNFDPGTVNMGDYATTDTGGTPGESFGGMDLSGATSLAGALDSGSPDALSAPTAGVQAAAPTFKSNWQPYYSQLAAMGRGGGQVNRARSDEAIARAKFNQAMRDAGYA
jgi:hypothetical protein